MHWAKKKFTSSIQSIGLVQRRNGTAWGKHYSTLIIWNTGAIFIVKIYFKNCVTKRLINQHSSNLNHPWGNREGCIYRKIVSFNWNEISNRNISSLPISSLCKTKVTSNGFRLEISVMQNRCQVLPIIKINWNVRFSCSKTSCFITK